MSKSNTNTNLNTNSNANTNSRITAPTNTDIISLKAGTLIDTKQAAIQRLQQRKLAAENKAKMLAASGTSLYVKLSDGQKMVADFANCKFKETVDFDGSERKTSRFNYTIKLLQEPANNNQMLPISGRNVIFS